MSIDLSQLAAQLIEGNADQVRRLTAEALDSGVAPNDVLQNGLLLGMAEVGKQFRENHIFLPEVLVRARAMKAAMELLEPMLAAAGVDFAGKVVLGTVKGDIHDIGKNLVATMLRGAGFQVIDIGINVPAQTFVSAIREHQPDVLGMSALLTTTMVQMKANIDAIRAAGLVDSTRVIVGGAPVTKQWAANIGAHGYASNASDAVSLVRELVTEIRARRAAAAQ